MRGPDRTAQAIKPERVFDRNVQVLWGVRMQQSIPARALLLALACALTGVLGAAKDKAPVQYQIPLPPAPDFSAVDWLVGEWSGKTLPNSPAGDVRLTVNLDLEKHYLTFRGQVSLAATQTVAATKESWMGILSAESQGAGFTLSVFSSTGFISRYRVTVEGPLVRLNPEGGISLRPGGCSEESWNVRGRRNSGKPCRPRRRANPSLIITRLNSPACLRSKNQILHHDYSQNG